MASPSTSIAIVGAGIVGIATAYYLARNHGLTRITLIDRGQPMSFTSAHSGGNYRNWWPHPAMVAFTDRSIDLMEEIACDSGNRINMTRRGYVLATRKTNIDSLIAQLHAGLGDNASRLLRTHSGSESAIYSGFDGTDWQSAPDGVDILTNQALIRKRFPWYDPRVRAIIHIRRGGDVNGQQMGMYMLEYLRSVGVHRIVGEVRDVAQSGGFQLGIATKNGTTSLFADLLVNAAGPFAGTISRMLDLDLPIYNIFQQKIAFEDRRLAIARRMPFSIDLDEQHIDWPDDDRAILLEYPEFEWLSGIMPGAIHCRPEGRVDGNWIKLGWAYNQTRSEPAREPPLGVNFPEIVLRGAARLNPALKAYYGRLPRNIHHYGAWYTMTEENWPLIGAMGPEGAYLNCAMSGFGTMAACASGELCAATIAQTKLPDYAEGFSLARYAQAALVSKLQAGDKGVL